MNYSQQLLAKKEKAEKLVAEYLPLIKDEYLTIVVEALQDYISAIDEELSRKEDLEEEKNDYHPRPEQEE